MMPALQMSRGQAGEALKADGRTGVGQGRQRLRRALVVSEIALALPLLVAAVMTVRGAMHLLTGYQGYDPNGVLVFRATLPAARYPDLDGRRRFAQSAVDMLQTVTSAVAATVTNSLPAMPANSSRPVEIAGQTAVDPDQLPRADYRTVSPAFFDVLRIPLRGRAFSADDRADTAAVAIASESFARRFWSDGDAIGRRVRVNGGPWMAVFGICGDVIHDIDRRNYPTLYRPITQDAGNDLMFAIRTKGDPLASVGPVRAALARIDRSQAIYDEMPMRQALTERTIGLRFAAAGMGMFALLALLLALLGLYAVMSYLVVQRVREIGVRIALGATARDVAQLALGQAARLTAIGIGIGLTLALGLGRLMEAGLVGVIANDIRLSVVLAAVLAVAALVSGYLPARRAAAVDPMVALRAE